MNKDVNSDYLAIQELHDKMQTSYECAQAAFQIQNCIPEVITFAQLLFSHPFFAQELALVVQDFKQDSSGFVKYKTESLSELEDCRILIANTVNDISALSMYIAELDTAKKNCMPNSLDLFCEMDQGIRRICLFLRTIIKQTLFYDPVIYEAAQRLFKKLAIIDQNGSISKYIFAPSSAQLNVELMNFERIKKSKLWFHLYRIHHLSLLYDLKKYSGTLSQFVDNNYHTAALLLKEEFLNLESVLTDPHIADDKILENCKISTKHIWSFFKPKLLNHEELTYTYNNANALRTGLLQKGKRFHKFTGNSAKILYLGVKYKNITKDELEEKTGLSRTQINNAIGVIQEHSCEKIGLENYMLSNETIVSITHHTRLITK